MIVYCNGCLDRRWDDSMLYGLDTVIYVDAAIIGEPLSDDS